MKRVTVATRHHSPHPPLPGQSSARARLLSGSGLSPALLEFWWATCLWMAALLAILALPLGAHAASVQLPKTGQTLCYDDSGGVMACAGTGQDGETQTGAAWPARRFTDNLNGTVTDNLSGLIWLKDASCTDIQSSGGSDWSGAISSAKTLHNGQCLLSDGSLAGDWRLPNVNELESLVDLSQVYPPLPAGHPFDKIVANWYWVSTVQAVYPNNAEALNLYNGSVRGDVRDQLKFVWPVRGASIEIARSGQNSCWDLSGGVVSCNGSGSDGDKQAGAVWPSPRFFDNGNGTLTDQLTGLVWLKKADCFGTRDSQSAALAAARSLASGSCGLSDSSAPGNWRVPNRKELRSLVNYQETNGATWLVSQGFSNVTDAWYWSSDSFPDTSDKWLVKTEGGAWVSSWLAASEPKYLLPVRGQLATLLTLTYSAGANGSISGSTSQTVSSGGSGTQVTALANTGYHFVSWSDGVTTAARTDSNVTANLSVTASFAANSVSYTLKYSAGANGSISGTSSQTVVSGGSGTQVTALANTGYHFVSWSDGLTSAARTDSNVTANITVTASFAANSVSYTLKYSAGANGSITGSTSQTVNSGGSGTKVTAVANTGFHFVSWSDGLTSAARTDSNVTANISVTASFAINSYTLKYSAGANGSITGVTSQTVNSGGSGTKVTAVANTGYHFVSWSDGLASAARTDTNVTANITVTASFAANQLTVTFVAGTHGTISGVTVQTVSYGGSTSSVTAVPSRGYRFINWTDANGHVVSSSAALTLTNVTASQKITANFSK